MRFYTTIAFICCLGFLLNGRISTANAQEAQIVIDGSFDDWKNLTPALIDPKDSPNAEIDFGRITITDNGQFVHLLIELGRTVNIQKLDGSLHIIFDIDGKEDTGQLFQGLKGADIDIVLSPPDPKYPGRTMGGVRVNSLSKKLTELTPYTIGFIFGPTYASNIFELRISRTLKSPSDAPLFSYKHLRFKIVYENPQSNQYDETTIIDYALTPITKSIIIQNQDPLNKKIGSIRLVSWNTKDGSILKNPDPFIRCLNALSPDVILFQELPDNITVAQLQDFLNKNIKHRDFQAWNVVLGQGGGKLRCAIASTKALSVQKQFEFVPYLGRTKRSLRVAGAIIESYNKRILCLSLHLKCCGRAGSNQDLIRILEVEAIRFKLAEVLQSEQLDGVIIAGDFNMVGSRRPLDLLTTQLDMKGIILKPVDAYQLSKLSNATWADSNESYTPGRLDFLLYSIGKLKITQSFVLDTHDLAPKWLKHHGLKETDTSEASDHLPLVTDVHFSH